MSCSTTFAGQSCVEYDGLSPSQLSAQQSACTSLQGTVGTSCPSANLLGFCSTTTSGVTQKIAYYSTGGLTAAQAQMFCTTVGGTWTAAN
jgi:hypothetical protein